MVTGVSHTAGRTGPRISASGMDVANTRTDAPNARVSMNVTDAKPPG